MLGAADGAFILEKEKRTGDAAVLEVSGRDQPEQKLILKKNMERLTWELERAEKMCIRDSNNPASILEVEDIQKKASAFAENMMKALVKES